VQEAPACNGWTFWYVERADGGLVLLDALRQAVVDGAAGGL
jgi:hypothetical protein